MKEAVCGFTLYTGLCNIGYSVLPSSSFQAWVMGPSTGHEHVSVRITSSGFVGAQHPDDLRPPAQHHPHHNADHSTIDHRAPLPYPDTLCIRLRPPFLELPRVLLSPSITTACGYCSSFPPLPSLGRYLSRLSRPCEDGIRGCFGSMTTVRAASDVRAYALRSINRQTWRQSSTSFSKRLCSSNSMKGLSADTKEWPAWSGEVRTPK